MPPPKREPCKNFQRGSCRFGANCKFMHVTQQQPKPNTFGGFGSQTGSPFQQTNTQQSKPNPFGFGVQKNSPANVGGGFTQPNAFRPHENQWVRSEQTGNSQAAQSQSANHKCTDPNVCKQLIAEDFNNERPLWKLTCYGHYKLLPCDIKGDISFEELRAEAYSDAKRGLSLQSIVEREKTLERSKMLEFENLLRNPYTKNTDTAHSNHSLFPAAGAGMPSVTPQNSGPSPFSSVNAQQGTSPNMTFGVRTPMTSNSAFGQFQGTGPFGSNSVPSGPFGSQVRAQTGGNSLPGFGSSGMTSQTTHSHLQTGGNSFTSNVAPFGSGTMTNQGNQGSMQTGPSPFTSNMGGFANGSMNSKLSSSVSVSPQQIQPPAISQPPVLPNSLPATNAFEQRNKDQLEVTPVDPSLWLKDEWKLGEIPEQPPPDAYVR